MPEAEEEPSIIINSLKLKHVQQPKELIHLDDVLIEAIVGTGKKEAYFGK